MTQREDLGGAFKTQTGGRAQSGDDSDDDGEHGVREAYRRSTHKCKPVSGFGVFSRDRCYPALRALS